MQTTQLLKYDTVIIGSGIAGIITALKLAKKYKVLLVTKSNFSTNSSYMAQGGIAAPLAKTDSFKQHIADTMNCGVGLCDLQAVTEIVQKAPAAIANLQELGVSFSSLDSGELHLTKEGGHKHRRVAHVGDATGKAITQVLIAKFLQNPNITPLQNCTAIDLITSTDSNSLKPICSGVYIYDTIKTQVYTVAAKNVVLATGGASNIYLYSSNPETSSGDGIAMAWRAGCRVANLEFQQFHPTCFYSKDGSRFLITEAMRGEGAKLLLPNGESFMHKYHDKQELAPRDIVARAIDTEMKANALDFVNLDISHKSPQLIAKLFPNLLEKCLQQGIDIRKQKIPVVPAAHYSCGGVFADTSGRTDLRNLYAVGEVACTFIHGANRLASNSLLECAVVADNLAENILNTNQQFDCDIALWKDAKLEHLDGKLTIKHNWDEVCKIMWNYVGIARSNNRLRKAERTIASLKQEINYYYSQYKLDNVLLELRNATTVAELTIKCALSRKESRGLHFNKDYPEQAQELLNTVLIPSNLSDIALKIGDGFQIDN